MADGNAIHPTAQVDPSARIAADVAIAALLHPDWSDSLIMRSFSAGETREALAYPETVEALRKAFQSEVEVPVRHHHTMTRKSEPDATLLLMPAWETLPFEHVSPNAQTMALRARARHRLAQGEKGLVVVAPVRAVVQRSSPSPVAPLTFARGIEVDLDGLTRTLADLEKHDLILLPTCPTTAFDHGAIKDPVAMYMQDIFTVQANLAGTPAISIPTGTHSNGLPFGMQLIGRPFGEAALLAAAEHLF